MKKGLIFAGRCAREMARDPISYIFCLGLPVGMILLMNAAFYGEMTPWFALSVLAPGVGVFALAFVMLNTALLVSRDVSTAFLARLFVSPMSDLDFAVGYALPGLAIGLGQMVVCHLTGLIVALCRGESYGSVGAILLSTAAAVPSVLLFCGIGLLFGTLFGQQTAPGIASAIITVSGFFGGAWTPVETLGQGMQTVCRLLPFYPGTLAVRSVFDGAVSRDGTWLPLLTVLLWALGLWIAAVLAFRARRRMG